MGLLRMSRLSRWLTKTMMWGWRERKNKKRGRLWGWSYNPWGKKTTGSDAARADVNDLNQMIIGVLDSGS